MTCFSISDISVPILVSRYSDSESILIGIDQFVIRNLRARRGIDGPQVILNWEPPLDPISVVTLIRIVRRLYAFPINEIDGTIVFEGPVTSVNFADCDVPADKCIYYKVFSFRSDTGEWVSNIRAQVNILSLFTGDDHWRKLFTYMGESVLVGDKDLERSGKSRITLDLDFGPDGECFNIHEIGDPKGPLARFYKLIGAILDEIKELIDNMINERNVDEACSDFLPLIASVLGLEVNRELSIARQRFEIKNRVAILKVKGTLKSIEAILQSVTGFDVSIKEWCDSVFVSNKLDSLTPKSGVQSSTTIGTANDTTHYSMCGPGRDHSCKTISIFIDLLSSKVCVPNEIIKKALRSVSAVAPTCLEADLFWNDEVYIEEFDLDDDELLISDEVETTFFEESPWEHCWIISNNIDKVSNNVNFVTPGQGGSCGESWFDEIEMAELYSRYSDEVFDSPSP